LVVIKKISSKATITGDGVRRIEVSEGYRKILKSFSSFSTDAVSCVCT
jgi:hypothetical protein